MANKSVPQDDMSKEATRSALRVAQMCWHLNRSWGDVDGTTNTEPFPSLNEDEIDKIAKRADKIFRHIIAGEPTAATSAAALAVAKNVVRFPGRKKRGAKVRTGPCAAILTFFARSAPDRLTGENLLSEWGWIRSHHADWDDEKLSGRSEKKDWQKFFFQKAAEASIKGRPMPDGDAIRKEIAEYRVIIEKRIRVKDWLETRGVNWDEVKSPELALLFIFDRLHASEQPASA